jgi:5-methylcytosine-specific restriction enzyme B
LRLDRAKIEVPADNLTRLVIDGKQSIFENDVHWSRFCLAKAGLVSKPKRGLWGLTPEGRAARLTPEETWVLYVRIRDANRPGASRDERDVPAPDIEDSDAADGASYWFVGALWNGTDEQTPRFVADGIWENGYTWPWFCASTSGCSSDRRLGRAPRGARGLKQGLSLGVA